MVNSSSLFAAAGFVLFSLGAFFFLSRMSLGRGDGDGIQGRKQPSITEGASKNTSLNVKETCAPTSKSPLCLWNFQSYESSAYEKVWEDHAKLEDWGRYPCRHYNDSGVRALTDAWVSYVGKYEHLPVEELSESKFQFPGPPFSKFLYKNSCSSSVVEVPIEPFALVGRHPSTCVDQGYLLDKSYLLVERRNLTIGKNWYFDLGASLWDEGGGGASQKWIHETYKARGVNFDGIFAWEASSHDPKIVWGKIPGELRCVVDCPLLNVCLYVKFGLLGCLFDVGLVMWFFFFFFFFFFFVKTHERHVYRWFNIPANPDVQHPDNPLAVLRKVVKREDFLVLKLDIDNTPIEEQFIAQLMGDESLSALVDEMFFEHHYNMEPLVTLGWGGGLNKTMDDSAKIFLGLRRKGVRIHVWV